MKNCCAAILVWSLFAAPCLWAEGIASWTTISGENVQKLDHHTLGVSLSPSVDRVTVGLIVRADKEHPLDIAEATAYDETGKRMLFRTELKFTDHYKKDSDGGLVRMKRAYFDIAKELIDTVEISYFITANEGQSHSFSIPKGKLREVVEGQGQVNHFLTKPMKKSKKQGEGPNRTRPDKR